MGSLDAGGAVVAILAGNIETHFGFDILAEEGGRRFLGCGAGLQMGLTDKCDIGSGARVCLCDN